MLVLHGHCDQVLDLDLGLTANRISLYTCTKCSCTLFTCTECSLLMYLNGNDPVMFHPVVDSDHSQLKTCIPTSKAQPTQSHDHMPSAAAGEHEKFVCEDVFIVLILLLLTYISSNPLGFHTWCPDG